MFERGAGRGAWGTRRRVILPLAACLLPLALPGCRTVVDTVAGVFGPGEVGGAVDAHVVYRLRPDCPALLARSVSNGYTVLGSVADVPAVGAAAFAGVEETGVFEGPVRTGEVVFRYVAPSASETWSAGPVDVVAQVDAVRLSLQDGLGRLDALCGPLPETAEPAPPDPTVPRLPPADSL